MVNEVGKYNWHQRYFETRGLCTILLPIGCIYTKRETVQPGGWVWNLVLMKIQPPCPTPLAPREMFQGGFGDFLFSMKLLAMGKGGFRRVDGRQKWQLMELLSIRGALRILVSVYSARSLSHHFLFTPHSGLHITMVLWNQRPLHCPAANRVRLHKEVNDKIWRLGLESCSIKDSTPLPNSIGTKRDASSTFVPK